MEYFKSGGPILKSVKRKIEEKKEEVKIRVKIIIIIEEDQIQNLILEERITTRSYSGNRRSYSYNNRRERNYREIN